MSFSFRCRWTINRGMTSRAFCHDSVFQTYHPFFVLRWAPIHMNLAPNIRRPSNPHVPQVHMFLKSTCPSNPHAPQVHPNPHVPEIHTYLAPSIRTARYSQHAIYLAPSVCCFPYTTTHVPQTAATDRSLLLFIHHHTRATNSCYKWAPAVF